MRNLFPRFSAQQQQVTGQADPVLKCTAKLTNHPGLKYSVTTKSCHTFKQVY